MAQWPDGKENPVFPVNDVGFKCMSVKELLLLGRWNSMIFLISTIKYNEKPSHIMCKRELRIWMVERRKPVYVSVLKPKGQEGEFPRFSFGLMCPKLVAEEASNPETNCCRTKSTIEVCSLSSKGQEKEAQCLRNLHMITALHRPSTTDTAGPHHPRPAKLPQGAQSSQPGVRETK